ncbi:MAG: MMPL family transporter [Deltaproteobacteria bacterium]|nr:MMPL family transporter [Deltaproteobacteria bacterium]
MLGRLLVGTTRWLLRHRAVVLLCWLLPLPLLLYGAYHVSARLKSIIPSRPGADSSVVGGLQAHEFPRQAQFVAELTFHDPRWTVDDAPFRDSVVATHAAVRRLPCVELLTSWPELPLRSSFVSPDAHTQLSLVEIEASADDYAAAEECVLELRRAVDAVRASLPLPDLELLVTGAPAVDHDIGRLVRRDGLRAELLVLAVSLVLLIWMFRSVAAAFLPLCTAGLGVSACLTVVWVVAAHVRLSVYVSTVSTMTGLALGLDYALLYVTRFREERAAGREPPEALEVTAATAGRAILGSGGLVLVGFAGLLIPDLGLARSIGLSGVLTVAGTLLSTLTLLPVLLSLLHRRLDWPRWGWFRRSHAAVDRFWERWSRGVLRRPVWPVLAGVLLVALCAPHLGALRVQNPRHEVIPPEVEARRGLSRVLEVAGEGDLYPIVVMVRAEDGTTFRDPARQRRFLALLDRVRAWPGVSLVQSADLLMPLSVDVLGLRLGYGFGEGFAGRFVSRNADHASFNVLAKTSDDATLSALVVRLRAELPALLAELDPGLRAWVGGAPARDWETRTGLTGSLPVMIPVVALAAFLLMALLFRSLLVPLKALLLNAASLATTYGILVLVFQHGWGLGLLGVEGPPPGGLSFVTPVILFCILFGVSMDYEVFLVARIQEAYRRRAGPGDPPERRETAHREAIHEGLSRTGGIITNAALVAALTFAAFITGSLLPMKEMGFALALAVGLDATLVRMMLVPALLRFLGRRTWWWPLSGSPPPGGAPRTSG